MIESPAQGIGLALVLVSAVLLLLVLRRLRQIPVRSLRSKWLGAVVPVAATAAYIVLAVPPFNVTVLAGAFIVSMVLGTLLARAGGRPLKPDSHQRGISLAVWAILYLAAAATGLTAYGGLQAVAAVAVTAAAGLAFGTQIGVLVRPRSSSSGVAAVALTALIGLTLTLGLSVGAVRAGVAQPDPCTFMDVTIWPGPILEDPGIQRGGGAQPSCTARFVYDTDEAGFILVGELTVIQFATTAEARASVESAGTVVGQTAVDLGDGGIEVVYVEESKQLYAAYFSVDNHVGWVKGQAYSDERIAQARGAASRLADLIETTLIALAAPTPTPVPTAPPSPVPSSSPPSTSPSLLPSTAPSATAAASLVPPSAAPTAPAEPSPAPSEPVAPDPLDPTTILAGLQTLGVTLTLGEPANPQDIENSLRGIGGGLAALIVGLFVARFGGSTGTGRAAKGSTGSTAAIEPIEPFATEVAEPAP